MTVNYDGSGNVTSISATYTGNFDITYQGQSYTFTWNISLNYNGTTASYTGSYTIDGQAYSM